jgi:cysteine desulfurase
MVHVEEVAAALDNGHDVALVSVMAANNEIGTLQPVAEIGALCRAHGIPFHTDAVQAGGRLALDVNALHVDALSLSAHKFYGPKGVGLLYLRAGTPFWPILAGGGQESGRRGGTENTPLIAGMAQALALAEAGRTVEGARLRALRDQLITGLCGEIEDIHLTGAPVLRLDNHASFVVDGADAEGM